MNHKTYYLFDLDGTLTDPVVGITTCVQYALAAYGIHEPDRSKLTKFIGPPLVPAFMEFYGVDTDTAQGMLEKYRERFVAKGLYENQLYPGIPQLLAGLKQQGKKVGLATSKPLIHSEKILRHFNILPYFDVLAGASMDGSCNTKEEVLVQALNQIELWEEGKISPWEGGKKPLLKKETAEKCVMIGDRKYDISGGRHFGIDTIGVLYGYGSREEFTAAGAGMIVESVTALQSVLLSD